MTKEKKLQLIANLIKALKHHCKNPPKFTDRAYAKQLAFRFCVNAKTMAYALNLDARKV